MIHKWIKIWQRNSERFNGFLLFLMLLLILNYSLTGNKKAIPVMRDADEYECCLKTERLSAYQKMTMGISLGLNSESVEGLTAIPGIGKSLADRIVKERIKRNGFKDINELRSVSGIGEKTFLKIAPHVNL